jgi:hypothetical protein
MRKLMVVVIRFLSLCAVLLALPAVAAVQRWCSFLVCPKSAVTFRPQKEEVSC